MCLVYCCLLLVCISRNPLTANHGRCHIFVHSYAAQPRIVQLFHNRLNFRIQPCKSFNEHFIIPVIIKSCFGKYSVECFVTQYLVRQTVVPLVQKIFLFVIRPPDCCAVVADYTTTAVGRCSILPTVYTLSAYSTPTKLLKGGAACRCLFDILLVIKRERVTLFPILP